MKIKNRTLIRVGNSIGFLIPANWEHYDNEGILELGKTYDLNIQPSQEEGDETP